MHRVSDMALRRRGDRFEHLLFTQQIIMSTKFLTCMISSQLRRKHHPTTGKTGFSDSYILDPTHG
jgi:hypothetical protein